MGISAVLIYQGGFVVLENPLVKLSCGHTYKEELAIIIFYLAMLSHGFKPA